MLCECLAEADTLATQERPKAHGMSPLSICCQIMGRFWVETVWDELLWVRPLVRVDVHAMDANH
jgi:hypothetical protein